MPQYRQSGRGYTGRDKKYDASGNEIHESESSNAKWHWSLTVTLLGIPCAGLALYIATFTEISVLTFWSIIIGAGTVSLLLQLKYFYSEKFKKKYFRIHPAIYVVYNYAGIGMMAIFLVLGLNYAFQSDEYTIEKYRIVQEPTENSDEHYPAVDNRWLVNGHQIDAAGIVVVLLEGDPYPDRPDMRAIPYEDFVARNSKPHFWLYFKRGLFGFKVFKGWNTYSDEEVDEIEGVDEDEDEEEE